MNLVDKIMKLANKDENTTKIIVFTQTFKVYGYIYDERDSENGILTLRDAMICDSFDDCDFGDDCSCDECGCDDYPAYDWLNIVGDQIVAFSLLKD